MTSSYYKAHFTLTHLLINFQEKIVLQKNVGTYYNIIISYCYYYIIIIMTLVNICHIVMHSLYV